MFTRFFSYLKKYDWILFFTVLLLVSIGLAEIYSVALGREEGDFLNFKKQLFFVGVGLILMLVVSFFDYHIWRSFSNYIYFFGVILLLMVLIFGQTIRGTRGWFSFGFFSLQPVEFIKFILILFLSEYFSFISLKVFQLKYLFFSGFFSLVFVILVLAQPDFGSALILFVIWLIISLVAGFKKKYFIVIALILLLLFSGGWAFYFKDYQKQRIKTFLNPSFDPLNQGYNVTQAIIAVGAGRLIGRGVGFGSQSQLKFLPESQNDFIFAVIAEELGFFGVSLLLILFGVFFYRCLVNARRANNDFGVFFILGVGGLIFVEMFINIGMNIGLLPVVGISLPFLSYGGSAIISKLIMIGVIESIVVRSA